MPLEAIAALAVVGVAVGFLSGLVGIGGGVLIVPFLYFFYAHPGWSGATVAAPLQATVSHATSLFIIVPTAVLGTATYTRAGLVAWRAVTPLAIAAIFAAAAGAQIAVRLPDPLLRLAFGCFLFFTAYRLVTGDAEREATGPMRLGLGVTIPSGILVGLFSALLGVGGGLVAIPLLLSVMRLDLKRVAATSLAVVAFAAAAGTVTYMVTGWDVAGRPAGGIGYVDAMSALPILAMSMISVRWGAWANQRFHPKKLRWVFAVLLAVLGVRLILASLGVL